MNQASTIVTFYVWVDESLPELGLPIKDISLRKMKKLMKKRSKLHKKTKR